MNSRRNFLASLAAAGTATALGAAHSRPSSTPGTFDRSSGANIRARWIALAGRLSTPVLGALAHRRLKATMPVEARRSPARAAYTHLEALGRLLSGLAPWLELGTDCGNLRELARTAISAGVDPDSPDFMNFTDVTEGRQPLVDAAFLAQAILRAPHALWDELDDQTRSQVIDALESTRSIPPYESNWLLFASMIEAFLHRVGRRRDDRRLFHGLEQHRDWYVGDGFYGDGAEFHWDYYNAFVIQPMLVEVLDVIGDDPKWSDFRELANARLTRFAAVQERLIAPDGSYPVVGRSITYRCGAFQGLALAALRHALPEALPPAQARTALTAVIGRTLEAPDTFDPHGWLRIGLAGHQPSLAEGYISTGSLYLCAAAFLPLGLPATDPFWSDPPEPTTWEKAWSGTNLPVDKAHRERR